MTETKPPKSRLDEMRAVPPITFESLVESQMKLAVTQVELSLSLRVLKEQQDDLRTHQTLLTEGQAAIQRELKKNTVITAGSAEALELIAGTMVAAKAGFRVLGLLGRFGAWLGSLVAIGATLRAVWGYFHWPK